MLLMLLNNAIISFVLVFILRIIIKTINGYEYIKIIKTGKRHESLKCTLACIIIVGAAFVIFRLYFSQAASCIYHL